MTVQKHKFAIYFEELSSFTSHNVFQITDKAIFHRLSRVLRSQVDDEIILFDNTINVLCKLIEINKNHLSIQILQINKNEKLKPKITFLVSSLKRDAFHEAIYYCTELGANIIQPVLTQKSYLKKIDSKEIEKLKKIIISAAEQSKNFTFPDLQKAMTLHEIIEQLSTKKNIPKIYFDPSGINLKNVLNEISKKEVDEIFLMVGPEGDLTTGEKELLKKSDFTFCCLTPTILRSQTAVVLALGIFRSFFCQS